MILTVARKLMVTIIMMSMALIVAKDIDGGEEAE